MDCEKQDVLLLELAAWDDLPAFRREVEEIGREVDGVGLWYGRRMGSMKMGFEDRTPLMIAAMFGSVEVLKYVIESGKSDVNRACGSDKATALHCAVAGGSASSLEVVKALLEASADADCVDCRGNRPIDVLAPTLRSRGCESLRRAIEALLRGDRDDSDAESVVSNVEKDVVVPVSPPSKEGCEKKEYPVDVSLPDINDGIYSTDEFRMYSFKITPCSRAYSHDWTECPFVHPGENARRRDPRKYAYTCVPCPEFRKGSCQKGDSCEYAHGVFESWLHPAQYRTRLCKDETGCSRRVCFFAHKPEELRPVYASTGSAMPSPKSYSTVGLDMSTLSAISLGSSSPMSLPVTSALSTSPPANSSSPIPVNMNLWQNKANATSPSVQLPGSRLKASLSARDMDFEMEFLGSEAQAANNQRQQLMDEISRLTSTASCFSRTAERMPAKLDDMFGSLDHSLISQLQVPLSPSTPTSQLQSPSVAQLLQSTNLLRNSYPASATSSPSSKPARPYGFDSSSAVATAVMNSRSSAFTKRSHSFIDRGAVNATPMKPSNLSDWSSPDGKLDWGVEVDELNKLRKSASLRLRSTNPRNAVPPVPAREHDISWVSSLVKDGPVSDDLIFGENNPQYRDEMKTAYYYTMPQMLDQLYREPEWMAA
ncbi:hypothetical protein MLD38_002677 [Melastoma candidum]|uniref:Uncharacterized protein n=1 Tax=Melastoma candidum TaxID=119954 RepID=A0ACB9S232_9MYRT|nr:hypothetical protein MLD38_002677 [Melastoma candidum]